jgi:CBS domain containing-hemolysin-like protein
VNLGALLAATVLLLVNGFFVAVEFALVGSRRTRLEPLAESGSRRARVALDSLGDLTNQLAGAQLGITIASLALGFVAEPAAVAAIESLLGPLALPSRLEHGIAFVIGLGLVVFFHLVVGEMAPKGATLADPERTLLLVALPNRAYLWLFRPVIVVLNASSNLVARALGIEPRNELAFAHTPEEFAVMLAESRQEGLVDDFAHDLLTGVLDFGGTVAADVMVPRDEIVHVTRSMSVADVEAVAVGSGHSRLPVVGPAGLDDVIGFVHTKDLLTVSGDGRRRPVPLHLVRRMLVVPEHRPLEEVLRSMRANRVHFAVVVGVDRSTIGIVTLEDLLEELVGDIFDETDR